MISLHCRVLLGEQIMCGSHWKCSLYDTRLLITTQAICFHYALWSGFVCFLD